MDTLEFPIQLKCMFLEWGRKLESPGDTGGNMKGTQQTHNEHEANPAEPGKT